MFTRNLFKHKHKNYDGMHINFDAVYQGDSKFARKPGKPKLRLSAQSSLTSETRHFGDAQFILLRILSSSKYIKNTLNLIMYLVRLM